jgi:hypothetical protein
MIGVACRECGRLLRVRDELAGKRIKCPHCGAVQNVSAAPAEEAAPQSEPLASREDARKQAAAYSAAKASRRRRRWFVALFALPGVAYGVVSAYMNQNPYLAWFSATVDHISKVRFAEAWRPSPAWLPSYLLSQAGIGMQFKPGWGYHFPSFFGWLLFYLGSVLLAAAPCATLGLLVSFVFRKQTGEPAR